MSSLFSTSRMATNEKRDLDSPTLRLCVIALFTVNGNCRRSSDTMSPNTHIWNGLSGTHCTSMITLAADAGLCRFLKYRDIAACCGDRCNRLRIPPNFVHDFFSHPCCPDSLTNQTP